LLGRFSRCADVDWTRVSRLVFLCKGNICRSAYAEHYARSLGMHSTSAGLWADKGKPADGTALRVARSFGVDLAAHRSRTPDELEFSSGDLVVVFEPKHLSAFASRSGSGNDVQATLLGLWSPRAKWVYIHDPYGSSELYFRACFDRINEGVRVLLSHRQGARNGRLA